MVAILVPPEGGTLPAIDDAAASVKELRSSSLPREGRCLRREAPSLVLFQVAILVPPEGGTLPALAAAAVTWTLLVAILVPPEGGTLLAASSDASTAALPLRSSSLPREGRCF